MVINSFETYLNKTLLKRVTNENYIPKGIGRPSLSFMESRKRTIETRISNLIQTSSLNLIKAVSDKVLYDKYPGFRKISKTCPKSLMIVFKSFKLNIFFLNIKFLKKIP